MFAGECASFENRSNVISFTTYGGRRVYHDGRWTPPATNVTFLCERGESRSVSEDLRPAARDPSLRACAKASALRLVGLWIVRVIPKSPSQRVRRLRRFKCQARSPFRYIPHRPQGSRQPTFLCTTRSLQALNMSASRARSLGSSPSRFSGCTPRFLVLYLPSLRFRAPPHPERR